MKKLFLIIMTMAFLLGMGAVQAQAQAIPIMWDVAVAGAPAHGDGDTLTGVFDEITFNSQTTTIQYDNPNNPDGVVSAGDKFEDAGNLWATNLKALGIVDTEGMNTNYEVTANWSKIDGVVTAVSTVGNDTRLDLAYTGGTMNFYLDTDLDHLFANPATSSPPAGAGGSGFADGTLIASMDVVDGIGHTFVDLSGGPLENQGSVDLALQFTFALDDFWLDAGGIDLTETYQISWIIAMMDMNINTPTNVPHTGALYKAYSNQDGSISINPIPEPATMLLLGSGLIGLAGFGRKKKFFKKS